MYIGAGLEGAVHPGDEGDFVLHFFQRLQRGREREWMHANGNARAIAERFAVRGEFWDRAVGFAGEKAASHHADGHIKKRGALGGLLIGRRQPETFQPRQAQGGSAESVQKCAS